MLPISELPATKRLLARLEARKAWEYLNPEMTAAWNLAMEEDAIRDSEREVSQALLQARSKREILLKRAEVPERFRINANVQKTKAMECAVEWLASKKPALVLFGSTGGGKTTAATWALGEILITHSRHLYSTGQEVVPGVFVTSHALSQLSAFERGDRYFRDKLADAKCLVIDDMGAESLNDYAKGILFDVLSERLASLQLRTIITSNATPDVFKVRYGERLTDRLREGATIKRINEPSMRVAQKFGIGDEK